MAWVPLLLAVLAHTSGSLVQAALTQPPSLSHRVGDTVKIPCSGSSYNWYDWFQQKVPGSAPVTVIYANSNRPSNIPSRFSGSKSGSTGTLTITGVQAEDEGDYYCGSRDSSSGPFTFGAGTRVTIKGSLVQAALTQPSSLSHRVGDTVNIPCSGSSGSYDWFQQKVPGSAPVTVIYENDNRPLDIPLRFSGSKSGSTGTLTITGVQPEDGAVYYCGSHDSSSSAGVFGAGTMLTIAGLPKTPPTPHLFPLSPEEFRKRNTATLVCLIYDPNPNRLAVEWEADGTILTNNVHTRQSVWQRDREYLTSSYLSLDASEWQSYNSVSCKVKHEAGNVEKTVNRS
ncbi:PREDICTED: immunoglobulin lambda-like polypeptide 1 [Lepidothrix coronata]|uniref:immunoglobulin lambda-like polypeptide 1 n=1 Tax=Lepidothrix coronata TaxID=321398 RepID=UPI000819A7BE|nr:PREDICTED: immunoglobulin lambda-like polypeptide 1 [Lepidothrix coronata]